jgi:hypothetical protein
VATTDEEAALLRSLADKQEIHDLLMRYCRGVDRADAKLVAGCFHPGSVDDHGDFVLAGEDAAALYATMMKGAPRGGMHFVGNVLIELDDDTAFAESYFMGISDLGPEADRVLRVRAGRYIDRLERRDGRWGIVERVLADEWNQANPLGRTIGGPERFTFGRRDGDDPVFAIQRGRVARSVLDDPAEIAKRIA